MQYSTSKFESVELHAGPFDGQTMNIPTDEQRITLRHAGREHVYIRLNRRPVLHHQSALVKVLGGGK